LRRGGKKLKQKDQEENRGWGAFPPLVFVSDRSATQERDAKIGGERLCDAELHKKSAQKGGKVIRVRKKKLSVGAVGEKNRQGRKG